MSNKEYYDYEEAHAKLGKIVVTNSLFGRDIFTGYVQKIVPIATLRSQTRYALKIEWDGNNKLSGDCAWSKDEYEEYLEEI